MGLENRFGNNGHSDKGSDDTSNNKNNDVNSDMKSDSSKNNSSGSDSSSSGGDGFKDKMADKAKGKAKNEALKNIPGGGAASGIDISKYAGNLQDVLQGKKSKEDAAKDVAKQAAKDAAREGLKQGAKAAVEGLGHGLGHASPYIAGFLILVWLKQKLDRMMYYLISSALNNPVITWISNAIGAISQSGFFHTVGQVVVGGAKAVFGGVANLVGGVVHGVSAGLHMLGGAVSGLFSSLSGSSAVGAVTGFIAQVTAVIVPVGLVAAVGTTLLSEPKQSDSAICTVLNDIGPAHYGKLGKINYYPNDKDKTAKSLYDAFRHAGYSAYFASGLLGNWNTEAPGFNPKAYYAGGHAFGLTQWDTHSNRYQGLIDYAKKHNGKIDDLSIQAGYIDYEFHHDYASVRKIVEKANSPAQAAWFISRGNTITATKKGNKVVGDLDRKYYNSSLTDIGGYEGDGDMSDGRPTAAEAYYKKFANGKVDGSDNNDATSNDIIGAVQSALGCNQSSDDDGDTADWTGTIKESIPDTGMHWSWKDVPSDIKKYVHDPEKVGMKYDKMGEGWNLPSYVQNSNAHDRLDLIWQCVTFAESYFLHTHKNMSSPKDWVGGDGGAIAQNFANKFGGKLSKRPNAGAVASAAPYTTDNHLASGPWGHVFVVTHVLKNGDLIGLEENMVGSNGQPLSGSYNFTVTWDVLVLKKSTYTNWGIKFYTPDAKKYPAKWSK